MWPALIKPTIYLAFCLSLIAIGWFANDAHTSKAYALALQKAEQKYASLREKQVAEREALERKITDDHARSEQRIRKAIAENEQLRAEADAVVAPDFLIYAGLCDSPKDCSLYYGFGIVDTIANPTSGITSLEVYETIRILDEQIAKHNLGLQQIRQQLTRCNGR